MEEIADLHEIALEAEKKTPKFPVIGENGMTAQEELFCQAFAKHGDQIRAVQEAGYQVKDRRRAASKAWKILERPKILKRIEKIKNVAAIRNDITVDMVIQMIQDTYNGAKEDRRFDIALQATKQLGDYLNLFASKPSTVTNIVNMGDAAVLDKEIRRLALAAEVSLMLEAKDVEFEPVQDQGSEGPGGGDGPDQEPSSGDIRDERSDVETRERISVDSVK